MSGNTGESGSRRRAEPEDRKALLERLGALRLALNDYADHHALEELLVRAIDGICDLTESPVGFIHFIDPDQQSITLQQWSTRTSQDYYRTEAEGPETKLAVAGARAECIRRRQPVVHNDVDALPDPADLPEGHVALQRELIVPVMRQDRVVAILGIGNRDKAYGDNDVELVAYYADAIWDLVERRRSADALIASERRFRAIFEQAAVGVAQASPNGRIEKANKAFCEIVGYTAEELALLTPSDITHPDDREADARNKQRLTDGEVDSYRMEKRYVRKDGKSTWVNLTVSRIQEADGDYLLAVVQDVNEAKRLERERTAAMDEAALLRTGLTAAMNPIIVTNPQGRIEWVNPAFEATSGYTAEEVLGRTPRILKSGVQDAEFYQALWADITAGKPWRGRMVNRRKTGEHFTVDAVITPVLDAEGRVSQFIGIQNDVTEQVQLEEQVRQTDKLRAIATLTSGIARDFNNLLASILGYSDLLKQELQPGSERREDAERIHEAGLRARHMVTQLIAFSRGGRSDRRPLSIPDLVRQVAEEDVGQLPPTLDMQCDIQPCPETVRADPGQIRQVLLNLLSNAADALGECEGSVVLTVRPVNFHHPREGSDEPLPAGRYVEVCVSDDGPGIADSDRDRVFEPFFTTSNDGSHRGMGLAVAYGIIRDHGGDIEIESRPDQGTTARFWLPCQPAEEPPD